MREEYEETLMKQRNIFDAEIVELSEVKPVNSPNLLIPNHIKRIALKQYLIPGIER